MKEIKNLGKKIKSLRKKTISPLPAYRSFQAFHRVISPALKTENTTPPFPFFCKSHGLCKFKSACSMRKTAKERPYKYHQKSTKNQTRTTGKGLQPFRISDNNQKPQNACLYNGTEFHTHSCHGKRRKNLFCS